MDRSLGDYAVLSFSIVFVSEFGYPNCSQHILSALLPVVADHLSYDFRQPVFSSARHCFYNVRGCPAVHCVANSGESWLAYADSVPDTFRLHRALVPYWNRHHLSIPNALPADYSTSVWLFIITLFPMRAGGFACSMMPAGKIRFQSTLYRSIIYTFPKATMVVLKN
ncbi:MAG: hypothetical protein ACLUE2_19020 [Bacteroides cellulosilyticus]